MFSDYLGFESKHLRVLPNRRRCDTRQGDAETHRLFVSLDLKHFRMIIHLSFYRSDNFHLVPSTFPLSLLFSCFLAIRLPMAACHECYKHYKWGHELSHKSRKRLGCWVKLCGRTASYERTSAEIWGKERGRVRCKRPLCLSGCLGSPNNPLWLQIPQAKPRRASKSRTVCASDRLHSTLT